VLLIAPRNLIFNRSTLAGHIPMNAPLDLKMDKATFLRWASHQEGKYELVQGRPVMQETANRGHKRIAKNIERALDARLETNVWETNRGDLSAEIGDETRVPDVMVEPAGLDNRDNATNVAVLIVEVLSPSSTHNDMNVKPALYFKISSLEVYIVASQDTPYLWVWQRSQDSARTVPDKPLEIDDPAASVELAHLGIALPLAEIYRGVFKI
jgi:Uma2 family endonuclease